MTPDYSIDRPEVFTVVLTGGIASGKTVVSNHFARLGVPVIDTDVIARQVVEPGQPALRQIEREFGPEFLDAEGRLDRRRMRDAVFADETCRARLEAILHPLIAEEALRQVRMAEYPYCLLVIPLYAESGRWPWIDRVLVVDVPESIQIERLTHRDQIGREHAEAMLSAQAGRESRLALADDVIDNTGSPSTLEDQVATLHKKYLHLTRKNTSTTDSSPRDRGA